MAEIKTTKPPRPQNKPPAQQVPTNRPSEAVAPLNQTPRIIKEYNFSSASTRDTLVFGAQRPGHTHPDVGTPRTPRGPQISKDRTIAWLDFMRSRKIKRCICLLTLEELSFYEDNLLELYETTFTNTIHIPDIFAKGSMRNALEVNLFSP